MSKKCLVNPVQTAQTTTADRANNPLFKALQVSGSRKTSVYNLGKRDRVNGFYFIYKGLEVPISAVIDTNSKTAGILGVFFGNASDCPSKARGLCQLPTTSICYALQGQKQATRKNNGDGLKGMDSTFKGLLASYYWDLFESDPQTRKDFLNYCDFFGIDTLRFNLRGDFRHSLDISAVEYLASAGLKLVGYTARDDLADLLEQLAKNPRVFLNGSNRQYTNRFYVTTSLAEFFTAKHKCRGSCLGCLNCYHLRGELITVLVHGSDSETVLNDNDLNGEDNRQFIEAVSHAVGLVEITADRIANAGLKGLFSSLNKVFEKYYGYSLEELNYKSSKDYIKMILGDLEGFDSVDFETLEEMRVINGGI